MPKLFNFNSNYTDNLIEFLNQYNCGLYYTYDNIYKYISRDKDSYIKSFWQCYYDNITKNQSYTFPIKLLIDTLIYKNSNTVFAVYETQNGNFKISKGTKKIIAYDVLGLDMAHILFVSKHPVGKKINSNIELYQLMKKISPNYSSYKIIVDTNGELPTIHYAESKNTLGKWAILDSINKELLTQIPSEKINVQFLGKAYSTDNRIISSNGEYYCSVESNFEVNVSLDYIHFCSINCYYKKLTNTGISLDGKIILKYYNSALADSTFMIPNLRIK